MEMSGRVIEGRQTRLEVSGDSDIGECRRAARRLTEAYDFDEVCAGRVGIVATELATNIVRHARHGEMLIQALDNGTTVTLEVLAIDQGPGMHDTEACLRDGFSTGGTAGQGLGAVSRLSSTFDLFSQPGRGTVVLSRTDRLSGTRPPSAAPGGSRLQFGALSVAVAGESDCGDCWRLAENGALASVLVADGLGHGPFAAVASRAAASAFGARPFDPPAVAMERYHLALGGTRGAAAACAHLDIGTARVRYSGVGNISGSLVFQEQSRGMVSHNGTLGVQRVRSQEFDYPWPAGGLVIMHSDGLSARWQLSAYPGLTVRHPALVAAVLYRDFVRRRDDATVIVVRYGP